jgi:hypothetical protein
MIFNLARGLDIYCDCFSVSTEGANNAPMVWYVVRDGLFLLPAFYLFYHTFWEKRHTAGLRPMNKELPKNRKEARMKRFLFPVAILFILVLVLPACSTESTALPPTPANEVLEWELVNPQGGAVEVEKVDITPHPSSLEGKTIGLRWNGKAGGDIFLDRVAELLIEQVQDVEVIKIYEVLPETVFCCRAAPADMFDKIAALGPDLVIGAQCD